MTRGKVLMIRPATNRTLSPAGAGAVGQYFRETAMPLLTMIDAGYEIILAAPHAPEIAFSPISQKEAQENNAQGADVLIANDIITVPVRELHSVIRDGLSGYAGVFLPSKKIRAASHLGYVDIMSIQTQFRAAGIEVTLQKQGSMASIAALPHAHAFAAAMVMS